MTVIASAATPRDTSAPTSNDRDRVTGNAARAIGDEHEDAVAGGQWGRIRGGRDHAVQGMAAIDRRPLAGIGRGPRHEGLPSGREGGIEVLGQFRVAAGESHARPGPRA